MNRFLLRDGCIILHDKEWPPVIRDNRYRATDDILIFTCEAMNEKYARLKDGHSPVSGKDVADVLIELRRQVENLSKLTTTNPADKLEILSLKNEVQMWKMQAEAATYKSATCACMWENGEVVSFCGAHQKLAYLQTTRAEDRLAEKYRKITEGSEHHR